MHTLVCERRWFAKLLLEGALFTSSAAAGSAGGAGSVLTASTVKELRAVLNKSNLKDGSAAVVTQMKPIPKVRPSFVSETNV